MLHNTKISIIVAMDEKRGIGKDNKLLFKIPEDMKRMKTLTIGHPLVMGRKTFESLGRLLPDRTHIVVTRDPERLSSLNYRPHFVVSSVEEGIEVGKKSHGGYEIFIFGGAQIYADALKKDLVDRLYLTVVKGDYKADAFFPEYSGFKIKKKEIKEQSGYFYSYLELGR